MVARSRIMTTEYTDETEPLQGGEELMDIAMEGGSNHSQKEQSTTGYFFGKKGSKIKDDNCSLPSWVSPPGSPQSGSDEYDNVRSTLVFTAKKRKSTFSFAVVAFSILGFSMYSSARASLRVALDEANHLIAFSDKLNRQMRSVERDVRLLERELAALDVMEQKREDMEEERKILDQAAMFTNPKVVHEMTAIQHKLKQSANQAQRLKEQVIEISKRDAISKYGAGTLRVEVELVFPGNLAGPTRFVLEMAPIELMPHSVFTFMEMVSAGLLDGCSFILNAMHVLKAAPLPYDGSPVQDKAQQFLDSGLGSVAFREYSHEYPHKPYTVGFAADGSPSFYINTEDNTEIHVGDPCFAKVVSGLDAIKRLEASPTRNGIWFENRIGIKKASIL